MNKTCCMSKMLVRYVQLSYYTTCSLVYVQFTHIHTNMHMYRISTGSGTLRHTGNQARTHIQA